MAAEHKHLIIRANMNFSPIDERWAEEWISSLVEKIGMKILMGPFARYCNVEGNRGLTVAVIIETSHIVLHTWDEKEPCEWQLDVYTCSSLNKEEIFDELYKLDRNCTIEYKFLNRQNGLIEI